MPSDQLTNKLQDFGRNSLGIYVMQFCICRIYPIQNGHVFAFNNFVLLILTLILSYLVAIFLSFIIKITSYSKLTRLILWGKIK